MQYGHRFTYFFDRFAQTGPFTETAQLFIGTSRRRYVPGSAYYSRRARTLGNSPNNVHPLGPTRRKFGLANEFRVNSGVLTLYPAFTAVLIYRRQPKVNRRKGCNAPQPLNKTVMFLEILSTIIKIIIDKICVYIHSILFCPTY